jgi:hypothetical protein
MSHDRILAPQTVMAPKSVGDTATGTASARLLPDPIPRAVGIELVANRSPLFIEKRQRRLE